MSNRQTARQLMVTPAPMLAWLRTFAPGDVVTQDIVPNSSCLGANFVKDFGHADGFMDYSSIIPDRAHWFVPVLYYLTPYQAITAAEAIAAILACHPELEVAETAVEDVVVDELVEA